MAKRCGQCGTEWTGVTQPGTREACASCGADLHACRHCLSYDEQRPYACRETAIDPVQDKTRNNFCELFRLADRAPTNSCRTDDRAGRAAFDRLFRK